MKLQTKTDEAVTELSSYGALWAQTFVDAGCDDAMIDIGDATALSDFIATLREHSNLKESSIEHIAEQILEYRGLAEEIENGARDYLLEHGYVAHGDYYFVAKDIANGDRC